jgi:hypothetical protein
MDQRKMIIRIGKHSLSFTQQDATNKQRPIVFEPYVAKSGVTMAVNLRESLKSNFVPAEIRSAQVLIDTPSVLVPIEQFEESEMEAIYNYTFPTKEEQRTILYNVLPNLKSVSLFATNKDLHGVLTDRFDEVQFILAIQPVWHHLHQRSFTGHRSKLYGYFHGKSLSIFSFQQNRFKFCNTFEASHTNDALYFLLYVWKQLRLEAEHDELHIVGDFPEQDELIKELKRYLQNAYIINPKADFLQAPATKVEGLPYDLMTLLVKGR